MLTGATEFPNLHEAHVAVLDAKPATPAPSDEARIKFDALAPVRLAAPFERLRDRSDQILKAKGARPKIFLANLGTPADFTARATFAKSFFETGGIEASIPKGLPIRPRWPRPSKLPARHWPACARPTRSMPYRRLPQRRPCKPLGQDISIWQAVPASRKPRSVARASTISSSPAAMRWRRCRKSIG